ncbi:hypothetical protein M406DRAFT_334888 [Cryphonectria parasitica EP155]|uniref:Uncharacterized protein n=1 Tax=Cryphonectria parasitica (strain ATCC 38755 / EP155) TaxID=660469 RepID=A0A9P4XSX3_CRYP1|nr:uncharacterized protein M406DRAFT_334888 [Cryphonectria parasitica EP155]KAF3760212.1 hypothetical protein M406DRAFT_334888 [Cryphonectria parasitica EP155]
MTASDGDNNVLVHPLMQCVLNAMGEYNNLEMAAASVALGLLPTIQQSLGSTTVGGRRYTVSTGAAGGGVSVVAGASEVRVVLNLRRSLWPLVSLVEYAIISCAVANVGHLAYQLSVHAVLVWSPTSLIPVPLWTFLGVVIHMAGMLAMVLLIRQQQKHSARGGGRHHPEARATSFYKTFGVTEFVPCAMQEIGPITAALGLLFYLVTWLLELGTTGHVLFGTLMLSSLLFYSVDDAAVIIARQAVNKEKDRDHETNI